MSERTDTLAEMLVPYGVNEEEARIYLVLLEGGVMSALSISRKLKMGRTKVYRILDKLIAKEMVRQRFSEKGLTFEASDPTCLRTLVTRKEAEAAILKETLPELTRLLEQQTGRGKPGSKVLYYHGQKGLSQVNWNLLRATGEFVSFEVTTVDAYLPEKEADELRRELVENKIFSRNLYNSKYIRSFTQVKEMVTEWWEARYVDPRVLTINADVFIYNDVYAMCHYLGEKEVFCVEIYNQYLADMQRQLFEVVWQQARPYTLLNEEGEARLNV